MREVFAFSIGSAGRQGSKALLRAAQKESAHAGQIGQTAPMRGNFQPGRFERRLPGGRRGRTRRARREDHPAKGAGPARHGAPRRRAGGRRALPARDRPRWPPRATAPCRARQSRAPAGKQVCRRGPQKRRPRPHPGQETSGAARRPDRGRGRRRRAAARRLQSAQTARKTAAPAAGRTRIRAPAPGGRADTAPRRTLPRPVGKALPPHLPSPAGACRQAQRIEAPGKAGARFPLQFPEGTAEAHEEHGLLPRAHVRQRAAGRRRRRSRR